MASSLIYITPPSQRDRFRPCPFPVGPAPVALVTAPYRKRKRRHEAADPQPAVLPRAGAAARGGLPPAHRGAGGTPGTPGGEGGTGRAFLPRPGTPGRPRRHSRPAVPGSAFPVTAIPSPVIPGSFSVPPVQPPGISPVTPNKPSGISR